MMPRKVDLSQEARKRQFTAERLRRTKQRRQASEHEAHLARVDAQEAERRRRLDAIRVADDQIE